ncbi:hypothetical protein [Streptomyces niveus]|uniref:hypothetical protein n=1 Tax=Streptomyces niveus TaxID=193462 RepID=UPI0036E03D79
MKRLSHASSAPRPGKAPGGTRPARSWSTAAPADSAASSPAHLVTRHQVKKLLLTSRRGEQAPGAAELRAELTAPDSGVSRFVELGPDAVLTGMARECAVPTTRASSPSAAARDRRPPPSRPGACLYADGHAPNWAAL